ncbi:hypothetical protein SAMN04487846_2590 [Microbacterium sp. cf046]|uniref:hypothetical protein n=1 Tax=Microbacterium sp. cf046 TaxID=1761803 RepID=UPI0008E30039|nr:hypothetical protein [Microbacterium sp. cf046]SFS12939.1 hypothetical protein SAMN04487846_2590 [Microbacterium sp. cf046]
MIDVDAPAGRYREALAELPLSARHAARPEGAIVVVPGRGAWVDDALAAVSAGAIALVIAGPAAAPAAHLRRLAGTRIPIVLERVLLRADVSADAVGARAATLGGMPPRVLVADVAASRAGLSAATRDAVGWLRVLAGESLTLVAADGGLALLETSTGTAATLTAVVTARSHAGRIRVQALGEVITDVAVEGRAARLATASPAGRLISPPRFESSERLAVRRAVEALAAQTTPTDLSDLVADTELVEQILRPAR